ncbi:MAG: SoxR reducing system RseC family protein [Faecousia sp.]
MEQLVRIREVYDNGTAQVVCVRESACSGDCHKCAGCGAAKETILLTADNPIGAGVGDLVNIRSESGPVLKAAVVLYMMPLVLFFVGYALAAAMHLSGALMGSLAFLLSIVFIVLYDRRLAKTDKTIYTITGYAADHLPQSKKRGS